MSEQDPSQEQPSPEGLEGPERAPGLPEPGEELAPTKQPPQPPEGHKNQVDDSEEVDSGADPALRERTIIHTDQDRTTRETVRGGLSEGASDQPDGELDVQHGDPESTEPSSDPNTIEGETHTIEADVPDVSGQGNEPGDVISIVEDAENQEDDAGFFNRFRSRRNRAQSEDDGADEPPDISARGQLNRAWDRAKLAVANGITGNTRTRNTVLGGVAGLIAGITILKVTGDHDSSKTVIDTLAAHDGDTLQETLKHNGIDNPTEAIADLAEVDAFEHGQNEGENARNLAGDSSDPENMTIENSDRGVDDRIALSDRATEVLDVHSGEGEPTSGDSLGDHAKAAAIGGVTGAAIANLASRNNEQNEGNDSEQTSETANIEPEDSPTTEGEEPNPEGETRESGEHEPNSEIAELRELIRQQNEQFTQALSQLQEENKQLREELAKLSGSKQKNKKSSKSDKKTPKVKVKNSKNVVVNVGKGNKRKNKTSKGGGSEKLSKAEAKANKKEKKALKAEIEAAEVRAKAAKAKKKALKKKSKKAKK